ncbi:sterol desaturase family protein [Paracoccus salsus]|uniref:sterol desaturase family protein n=1 Tax=Paracoccus salsus TaxID=2911061 RepID=UPI001F2F2194|nr:sterol desaturase family protein [Paracoccus salsus]MCF3972706.1 sterol desaturase family protein [Paracoccus salsus]
MIPTLRVLIHMGALQRLAPFFIAGLVLMLWHFDVWLLLAVAYGIVAQFGVEYAMHRFLLHRPPPAEQGPFNELYRSHIGHHEFPAEAEFFTGGDHWYAIRFGLISVGLHMLVLLPFAGLGAAFLWSWVAVFVGSVAAFAFYEYCHTLAHLDVPKEWFGRQVTHAHLRHHFNDHETNFHVSFGTGWIDRLFGTAYDKDTARARFDRKTILSMGMDPEDLRLVTARKAYGLPPRPAAGHARR